MEIQLEANRGYFERYGVTEQDLRRYLAEALSAGGDYADLYFEHLTSTGISVDESLIKSATQGISAGCGVRVLSGRLRTRWDVLLSQRIDAGILLAVSGVAIQQPTRRA